MLTYPQQIELLNLKERIVGSADLRLKLIDLLGQSKGWHEFSEELGYDYSIVRHLKEMAICELQYTTRDFTALRAEVYNEEKESMLRHTKRKAVIIINSPNASIELLTISHKPLTIVTARKASPVTLVTNKKRVKETVHLTHDTNVPIYIYGNIEGLTCVGQRLTECYLLNCPDLSFLDVSNNQLKQIRLCQSMPKLKNIHLQSNCLQPESLTKLLPHLCQFKQEELFEIEPEITTDIAIPGDIRWQAKQIGWIIKNV